MTTPKPAAETPPRCLARNQPCGCVVCYCEDEECCLGCGAKNCGTHPVGEIPNPVYVPAAAASLSPSPADGWGWCPNTTLRIPKGECGCCPDPDTRPAAAAPLADGAQTRRKRACVIGGFDCAIDLPLHETVGKLRAHAVEEMRERKPAETWECRDAKGYWLEPGTQLGAVAHWPIYFNQPIGWGG